MTKNKYNIIFSCLLLVIFAWAVIESISFQPIARHYPLYIGIGAIILIIVDLFTSIRSASKENENEKEYLNTNLQASLLYLGWIIGYLVVTYIIGFLISTPLFLLIFLKIEAEFSWLKSIVFTVIVLTVLLIFSQMLTVDWPSGLIGI